MPVGGGLDAATVDMAEFMGELTSRNARILTSREQLGLQAMRILIAGCGTVGGSVAEPLVRLGVTQFALADPDIFDATNLNRQVCHFADVGRPKAEVLAERIKQINPFAEVEELNDGLTEDNLDAIVGEVSIVFDGIDAFTSLWEKYLLHEKAAKCRIPVIAGSDYGGKPTLYVFDYRRDPRPLYGKASAEDHRQGRHREALRWLGIRPIPTDFLPVIGENLTSDRPWPQIAYCAFGMGALASRTVVDLAMQREVPHVIACDFHMQVRKRSARIREGMRRPFLLAQTLAKVRLAGHTADPHANGVESRWPTGVGPLVEALRLAPSFCNSQPWSLAATGKRSLKLELARGRWLSSADPDRSAVCQSLGCAIEAASAVAKVDYLPGEAPTAIDDGWMAGELKLEEWRPDYARAVGMLGLRRTSRGPYTDGPIDPSLLRECEDFADGYGIDSAILTDPDQREQAAKAFEVGVEAAAEDPDYVGELLRWTRVGVPGTITPEDGCRVSELELKADSVGLVVAAKAAARFGRSLPLAPRRRCAVVLAGGTFVMDSGALVLLAGANDPLTQISVGRALMRLWLAATRRGVAFHPLALSEDALALVSAASGLPKQGSGVLVRLGHALCLPSSRRQASERIYIGKHNEG